MQAYNCSFLKKCKLARFHLLEVRGSMSLHAYTCSTVRKYRSAHAYTCSTMRNWYVTEVDRRPRWTEVDTVQKWTETVPCWSTSDPLLVQPRWAGRLGGPGWTRTDLHVRSIYQTPPVHAAPQLQREQELVRHKRSDRTATPPFHSRRSLVAIVSCPPTRRPLSEPLMMPSQ